MVGYHRSLLQAQDPSDAIITDLKAIGDAARDITIQLFATNHFGFLSYLATIAAIFLIVVDRTKWKTDLLTALLVPYLWLNLPPFLFRWLRGEVGKWIALIGVILRLFFPRKFPEEAELPFAFILFIVTAPAFLADTVRDGIVGLIISVLIGIYLLYQHIHNAGGFRKAVDAHGIPNTIGILLLFVAPVEEIIHYYIL